MNRPSAGRSTSWLKPCENRYLPALAGVECRAGRQKKRSKSMSAICRWISGAVWRKILRSERSLTREWTPEFGKTRDSATLLVPERVARTAVCEDEFLKK